MVKYARTVVKTFLFANLLPICFWVALRTLYNLAINMLYILLSVHALVLTYNPLYFTPFLFISTLLLQPFILDPLGIRQNDFFHPLL